MVGGPKTLTAQHRLTSRPSQLNFGTKPGDGNAKRERGNLVNASHSLTLFELHVSAAKRRQVIATGLVGHAMAIAGEAGQIYRITAEPDWGIDAEIEFKNSKGQASGKRVYLQLKSGDSYLYERQRDDAEVFTIKKKRHAEYWLSQAYPVMLVIRSSDGKIRWMNITEYLQHHGVGTKKVVFEGEGFTAPNVALMRNRILGEE